MGRSPIATSSGSRRRFMIAMSADSSFRSGGGIGVPHSITTRLSSSSDNTQLTMFACVRRASLAAPVAKIRGSMSRKRTGESSGLSTLPRGVDCDNDHAPRLVKSVDQVLHGACTRPHSNPFAVHGSNVVQCVKYGSELNSHPPTVYCASLGNPATTPSRHGDSTRAR